MIWHKPKWIDSETTLGASVAEEVTASRYCLQVSGPVNAVGYIQGSLDGDKWVILARAEVTNGNLLTELVWVEGNPVKHIRAVLAANGGGSVTISVLATD
jgi:hypothetical protein